MQRQALMLLAAGAMFLAATTVFGQDPNSPTTQWVSILYGNSNYPDPSADQQTGSSESDIVGNAGEPSLYMQYTNGYLGFRLRVGADQSPPGFKSAAFIGMDANGDGKLDLFVGVDNSGSPNQLGIYNPGAGANTSPSTTTINAASTNYTETSTTYSFTPVTATIDPPVTNLDLNADTKTDQLLTFFIPFTDISSALAAVGISGFTTNSAMSLVAATATQANSLNEDLNGVNGGINSSQTWSQLGAITQPYAPGGIGPVPEPSELSLLVMAGGAAWFHGHRRNRRN